MTGGSDTPSSDPPRLGWALCGRPAEPAAAAVAEAAAAHGGRAAGAAAALFDEAGSAMRAALAARRAAGGAAAPFAIGVAYGSARAADLGGAPGALLATSAAFAEARRWMPSLSARAVGVLRRPGEIGGVEVLSVLDDPRGGSAAPALRPERVSLPDGAALLAPFRAEGGPDALRLALGVSEGVAARLARWRDLAVVAPSAAALSAAEAGDPAVAARRVGARWAVEGALRREGDVALGTLRVLDAATGAAIWSGFARAQSSALLDIEAELADAVAAALGVALRAAAPPPGPAHGDAGALTRAALGWLCAPDAETWRRARIALDGALALDPEFPAALAARARVALEGWRRGWDRAARPEEAARLAGAALAGDALDASAWRTLAAASTALGDAAAARDAAGRAAALNSCDPEARAALAAALTLADDPAAALDEIRAAQRLHPSFPDAYLAAEAGARLAAGEAEAAAAAALRMRAPEEARLTLAAALLALGDDEAAAQAASLARAERPELDAAGWLARLALPPAAAALARRALALD